MENQGSDSHQICKSTLRTSSFITVSTTSESVSQQAQLVLGVEEDGNVVKTFFFFLEVMLNI